MGGGGTPVSLEWVGAAKVLEPWPCLRKKIEAQIYVMQF